MGDFPFATRFTKTRAVSANGNIKTAMAVPMDPPKTNSEGSSIELVSMNFMVTIDKKNPINKDPVSPINIFEGAQLKFRNAKSPPANAKEMSAKEL